MEHFTIMKIMKTEEKESLVSRRSFFRSTAQVVLPMLALTILSSCAPAKKLPAPSTCRGTCAGACIGLCAVTCGGACAGTCQYVCSHSTKL